MSARPRSPSAVASHCQPSALGVSSPSCRNVLSNSTVSYGLPIVRATSAAARPADRCASTRSMSATIEVTSATVRLSRWSRIGPPCCRSHRAIMAASGCVASTSLSR